MGLLKEEYYQMSSIADVFIDNCDYFGKQCLDEMKKQVNCKIQACMVGSKLFSIYILFERLSNDLFIMNWYNFNTIEECKKQLNKIVLRIEMLQIRFAEIQGNEQVASLKKKKVLEFFSHVNMSLAETAFLKDYKQLNNLYHIPKLAKRLVKMKRKMIGIYQMKENWTRPYLRQVKRYKRTEPFISECINFLKRRDYD